ncbi:pre-mRNA-splicing factor CWC22 homolog [Selaginella moellendorffii]|nr:pre-mRNA-splicing factor CWC22 homolog [Selaginella moellendorffii]|eukprot:XP_002968275.2 pre-mRNA-splicing factor CWC22 homolog [Selaginella moellendorffii]
MAAAVAVPASDRYGGDLNHGAREERREDYDERRSKRKGRDEDGDRGGRSSDQDKRRRDDARDEDRWRGRDEDASRREDSSRRGRDEDSSRRGRDEDSSRRGRDEDASKRRDDDAKEEKIVLPAGRSGGTYIPPFKLAQMMRDVKDKTSVEYQRMAWDALRKSINGLVNKVNTSNIRNILKELIAENLIRGRGLFARSCMKSQMASPAFTHVFAGLVAVINTKFPALGGLLLTRIILQFRRAFKRNDKPVLLAVTKFLAHLVNQRVAHEVIALELLMLLLENPTDDSIEVAVGFLKECGAYLLEISPKCFQMIFDRFRAVLHEGEIDKRVQFMIEGVFALRKSNFQGHPAIISELDLVEEGDQETHQISLLDKDLDPESRLDIFAPDPDYLENEKKYETIKNSILGDEKEEKDGSASGSEEEDDEDEGEEEEDEDDPSQSIQDLTETNLVNLRRTIYLTIMSSVDFEEAGHKLLKIKLEPGQEKELCIMLLECCSQERTYLRYYGLLGQRFCMINQVFQQHFDECFLGQYTTIHRLETNKLRNVAKFFAHLLGTDALPWTTLEYINLTEEATTSSSRIFIKILFQELSEHLGLQKLNERLTDPDEQMQRNVGGIFPRDNPKNTRFAINFFTSIGLGGLTDSLREYLKNMPRFIMEQQKPVESSDDESSDSESSSSEPSSSSSSESDSDSDSSSDERSKKRRKK